MAQSTALLAYNPKRRRRWPVAVLLLAQDRPAINLSDLAPVQHKHFENGTYIVALYTFHQPAVELREGLRRKLPHMNELTEQAIPTRGRFLVDWHQMNSPAL
jgi:hypothetical protein